MSKILRVILTVAVFFITSFSPQPKLIQGNFGERDLVRVEQASELEIKPSIKYTEELLEKPIIKFEPVQSLTYVTKEQFNSIIKDNKITDEEERLLYEDYYKESPKEFISSGTWYGDESISYVEISFYGQVIRQQMSRGWVLVGSGEFGYHKNLENKLSPFIEKYYNYKNGNDVLLSKQASPLYFYFADGGINISNRDKNNQPIPVSYEELNPRQKRIYDITSVSRSKIEKEFIDYEQYKLTEQEAINSGKYASIVSTKSPNDFGKRYLIYRLEEDGTKTFYGVVLVGGCAKRADWTGLDAPTSDDFRYYNFPLITRETDNQHWGFDFPTRIYKWFGGNGGPVTNILAIEIED